MVYAVFMCMYLGTQLNSCKIYGSTCLNYGTRGSGYNCSPVPYYPSVEAYVEWAR